MTRGVTVDSFPVSLVLQCRRIARSGWSVPHWELLGVVAGEQAGTEAEAGRVVRDGDGCRRYLWNGFRLQLHRDGAESYWHNLVGRNPSLFVVLQQNDDGEMYPVRVSANYDEAGAHLEADDTVLSAPMPPEVYRWLEDYVVTHYRPSEPKTRKRRRWTDEVRR
ncbi:MAG TPA: DUF3305 domain-containing protein [Gammaproteobacteria bacterium]|nr:DUF3305 domain-containing protein [Gammaproteobacteria bacterium]